MSFTDKLTNAMIKKLADTASGHGIDMRIVPLENGAKKAFNLPDSSNVAIELKKPGFMFNDEWDRATGKLARQAKREIGLLGADVTLIGGTHIKTLVLKSAMNEGLNESAKVLDHLLQGLALGFKYSEESYYEDHGHQSPYKVALLTSDEDGRKVAISLNLRPNLGIGTNFRACCERLWAFAEEYLAEEGGIFNIKLHQVRTFAKFTVILEMK